MNESPYPGKKLISLEEVDGYLQIASEAREFLRKILLKYYVHSGWIYRHPTATHKAKNTGNTGIHYTNTYLENLFGRQ